MRIKALLGCVIIVALLLTGCSKSPTNELSWQEHYDLGVRYLSEENYEEAVIAFTAAIEIDPKNEELYISLAEAYIGLEDFDRAYETLSTAAEVIGRTEAIMQAQIQLQNLMMQEDGLFKEIGEDGLNQYGGTPFILRDNYIPYSELGEAGQTFFQQVIAALSANQRNELLALAEVGADLLSEKTESTEYDHIYTTCNGYKIYLETAVMGNYVGGAYKTYGWSIQVRPESGVGYYARIETDELIDASLIEQSWYDYWNESLEVASCPCEQWQWNGTYSMEETSRGSQHIDGEDRDISAYSNIIGEIQNSLRYGNFYEDSYVTYQSPDREARTTEREGEAVFQDGLCINVVKDGRHSWVSNGRSRYTIDGTGYGYDLTMKKMLDILYW